MSSRNSTTCPALILTSIPLPTPADEPHLRGHAAVPDDGPAGLDLQALPRLSRRVPEGGGDLLVADIALAHSGEHAARAIETLGVEELGDALEAPLRERLIGLEEAFELLLVKVRSAAIWSSVMVEKVITPPAGDRAYLGPSSPPGPMSG